MLLLTHCCSRPAASLTQLVPWARAAASIRCSTSESQVAQDVLVTGERCGRAS